jgi:hypothetical protein
MNKPKEEPRRYRVTGQRQGGGSGVYEVEAVIQVPEGEDPPKGARKVADDAPLHDWRPVNTGT